MEAWKEAVMRFVIVTGMSGAGKSTALNYLERTPGIFAWTIFRSRS